MEQLRLSYSQLTAHRKCPQSWFYAYEQDLTKDDPEDTAVERDLGSWWAMLRAAEAIERGRRLGSLQVTPKPLRSVDGVPAIDAGHDDLISRVMRAAEDWTGWQLPVVTDEWDKRVGEQLPERLDSMLRNWRIQWEDEIANERPLAVEFGWGRDLPKLGEDEPNCRLVGYVDEVYFDVKRNMVVVRDDKTSKSLGTQTTADDMMDSQLQLYAWGAAQNVASWGFGSIRATSYDRIRTTKPRPPMLTMAGRLSARKDTPLIGMCDLATYLEWSGGDGVAFPGTKKDGSGAGFYRTDPEIVEQLSSPAARSAWFQRTLTPLNSNLVRVHLRAAVDSAADLWRTKKRAQETGEAARNLTSSNCRWCPYAQLCRAQMVGGPNGDYDLADFKLRERAGSYK